MNHIRVLFEKRLPPVYRDHGYDRMESPDPSDRFPSTSIPVMTGRHWGLCVAILAQISAIEVEEAASETQKTRKARR